MDWEALGYPGDPIEWGGRTQHTSSGIGASDISKCFRHYTSDFRFRRLLVTLAIAAVAGGLALLAYAALQLLTRRRQRRPTRRRCTQPSPCSTPTATTCWTSGQAVSTMQTCGSCHDTTFIEQHSFHADLGLSDFGAERA